MAGVSFHRTEPRELAKRFALVAGILKYCEKKFSRTSDGVYGVDICKVVAAFHRLAETFLNICTRAHSSRTRCKRPLVPCSVA